MTYNRYILLIALFGLQAKGMTHVTIVNHNKEERLPAKVAGDTLVSIFGSTPRYSYFVRYMHLIKQLLQELEAAYAKNTRLKGISRRKTIKQLMDVFKKSHPDRSLVEQLASLSVEDTCKLFFKIGIDHKELTYNVRHLCRLAAKGGDIKGHNHCLHGITQHLMIHMLLPIYFDDCAEHTPSREELQCFLQEGACFYRELYEKVPISPQILIYVPPLRYFEEVVTQNGIQQETLATLFTHEVLSIAQEHPTVLINQNDEQSKALKEQLTKEGIDPTKILLSTLTLETAGRPTKSFTPYVLRFNEQRAVKTSLLGSPLFCPELLEFIIERGAQ